MAMQEFNKLSMYPFFRDNWFSGEKAYIVLTMG
jgi:hypothetical protein